MAVNAWIIVAASLLIVSAGCLSAGQVAQDSSSPAAPTDTTPSNATAALPVQATIIVQIDGNASEPVNGSIPALAGQNVTFDGTSSTGTNLTYAWALGDNATAEDAAVTHAYATPGAYVVTLTVTDPDGGTSAATVSMNITASGPPPGTFIRDLKKQFKGTVTQPVAEVFCGDSPAGMDRLEFKWTIDAAEPDGTLVKVSKFVMKITQSTTNIDTDFYLYDPAAKEVGSSHGFEPTDGAEKGFTVEGSWAPGDYKVVVNSCGSANNAVTVDMTASLVVA